MQSSLGTSSGLRVESFFPASENETDTDSDSGAFSNNRSRRSTNEEGNRLSTPELIRHAFNLAVIKVRLTITNELNNRLNSVHDGDLESYNFKWWSTDKISLNPLISFRFFRNFTSNEFYLRANFIFSSLFLIYSC